MPEPKLKDHTDTMNNIICNMIVLSGQVHRLAREQFASEHWAGSRSHSRGLVLAEIGTSLQGINAEIKKIVANLEMLKELPLMLDPKACETDEMEYHVF